MGVAGLGGRAGWVGGAGRLLNGPLKKFGRISRFDDGQRRKEFQRLAIVMPACY